jgi:hypothetical protein
MDKYERESDSKERQELINKITHVIGRLDSFMNVSNEINKNLKERMDKFELKFNNVDQISNKVSSLVIQVKNQWSLIVIILVAIISFAFHMLRNH